MEGAQQRTEVQYQMLLHLAWHTAYLTRIKNIPSLAVHLKKFSAKKAANGAKAPQQKPGMDWRAMKSALKMLSADAPPVGENEKAKASKRKVKT